MSIRCNVNVAAHLLRDIYENEIDQALVITNDGDLGRAVAIARQRVPVAVVNPSRNATAQPLLGDPEDGVGYHW
jgi:rRNA-processing protein FCF1